MKILFDSRVTGRDGIGRYTRNLLNAFIDNEIFSRQNLMLLLRDKNFAPPVDIVFSDESSHYTLEESRELSNAARNSKAQLLHCTDYRVPFPPQADIPLVVSLHDIFRFTNSSLCYTDIEFERERGAAALSKMGEVNKTVENFINNIPSKSKAKARSFGSLHQRYYEVMLRLLAATADVILAPTEYVKQEFESNFNSNAVIKVIPYGINHFEFNSYSNFASSQFERFKPYIIYVGQARAHKNILLILKICKNLSRHLPELKLLMVGDSFTRNSEFQKQIEAYGLEDKVILMGYLEDSMLPAAYRHAAALIHLSAHEGFGFTPLEALSQGTCAIVSDIPVFRELLGDQAIYFNENESDSILAAVSSAMLESDEQEIRNSRISHALNYQWKTTAYKTYQSYKTAINVFRQKSEINFS